MNTLDQECKNCKYRKAHIENFPCDKCRWEGEETGFTYWEPAEVEDAKE